MPHGLIAKKVGMSRLFQETGESVAVTYLAVEPNTIVRLKRKEKDGYDAVVLGALAKPSKSKEGHERMRFRVQKEWRVDSLEGVEPGKALTAALLPKESTVTITGVSKGKGFQGVMKRHGFSGGPASHGSHFKREAGSIGMRSKPGRIFRGHPMAGRMGGETVTLRGRRVLICDPEKRVIGVKGPVPGPIGSPIFLTLEGTSSESSESST